MNVSFYLLPKSEVAYTLQHEQVGKALSYMRRKGYQAIPVITAAGEYVDVISEGDFLANLMEDYRMDYDVMKKVQVSSMNIRRKYRAVSIDADISQLEELIMKQNFVPVVDGRNVFIGIVTRKTVIEALIKKRDEYQRHLLEEHAR